MANYKAISNGNWSSLAIWQDDSSGSYTASSVLPSTNDDVYSNNFSVTVDISPTVRSVRSTSAASVSIGGGFLIANNQTLSCIVQATAGADLFLQPSAGASGTVVSPLFNSGVGVTHNLAVVCPPSTTMNIIGNTINTSFGSYYRMTGGIMNITGNITSQTSNYPVDFIGGGTLNITGNVSFLQDGFWTRGNVNTTLIGSLTSGANTAYLNTNQNMIFRHIGPVIVGGNACAIVDTFGIYEGSGPFNNNGLFSAFAATRFRLINTGATYLRAQTSPSGNKFLYSDPQNIGFPSEADTRENVIYGPNSEFRGTLAVPPSQAVGIGVPVDNTVGTAYLTPQDWFDEIASSPDPVAERLRNVSTVAITAATIAAFDT